MLSWRCGDHGGKNLICGELGPTQTPSACGVVIAPLSVQLLPRTRIGGTTSHRASCILRGKIQWAATRRVVERDIVLVGLAHGRELLAEWQITTPFVRTERDRQPAAISLCQVT